MSNAVVHAPGSFNNGSSKTFASKNVFDAGLYSEPLGKRIFISAAFDLF